MLTLLALPAAAHAAEGQVAPADTFGQLAAVLALLIGAVVAGYFFMRPLARTSGWMSGQRPHSPPTQPVEDGAGAPAPPAVPAPPASPAAPPRRALWPSERAGPLRRPDQGLKQDC